MADRKAAVAPVMKQCSSAASPTSSSVASKQSTSSLSRRQHTLDPGILLVHARSPVGGGGGASSSISFERSPSSLSDKEMQRGEEDEEEEDEQGSSMTQQQQLQAAQQSQLHQWGLLPTSSSSQSSCVVVGHWRVHLGGEGNSYQQQHQHQTQPSTSTAQTPAPSSSSSGREATLWSWERKSQIKATPRLGRANRLALSDLLRYEVAQLAALSHPRLLRQALPIEETKELLAWASEPVRGSLEQLVAASEDGPLETLEIKLGILQLIDALSWLHSSAKILHGNLTPQAVLVTPGRSWKLGGFAFAVQASAKDPNSFPCFPWTKKLPASLQPDLDFLAPEYLTTGQTAVSSAADVFSLGCLIAWLYAGGKRLIDARGSLETYAIVCGQLNDALATIALQLGANLRDSLGRLLSMEVDQRPPVQMLALTKHFGDDAALAALRQLDELASTEFDPSGKAHFLAHTLHSQLPNIAEPLWFSRVLPRLEELLAGGGVAEVRENACVLYMLAHCESHNIARLVGWMRRLLALAATQPSLCVFVLENMSVLFRRLSDERVEDQLLELITTAIRSSDTSQQSTAVRGLPAVAQLLPTAYVSGQLLPAIAQLSVFLEGNVPRQLDVLNALAHLSDRCDSSGVQQVLACVALCTADHGAILHSKSRLAQRLVTVDASRLTDTQAVSDRLLSPLVGALSHTDINASQFDDIISTVRVLLDVLEQQRYQSDEFRQQLSLMAATSSAHHHAAAAAAAAAAHQQLGGGGLASRRVSMSSSNLPRVLISAARPSISSDSRKMSFLSADGRLEDRRASSGATSRRISQDSRASLESDISIRLCSASIGCASDVSDESWRSGVVMVAAANSNSNNNSTLQQQQQQQQHHHHSKKSGPGSATASNRRQSWLDGHAVQSVSFDQQTSAAGNAPPTVSRSPRPSTDLQQPQQQCRQILEMQHHLHSTSPTPSQHHPSSRHSPARPNSFTNLGHNLVLTYRNLWQKESG